MLQICFHTKYILDVLPEQYYSHWKLFVTIMQCLSCSTIEINQLPLIHQLLIEWVQVTEEIYGKSHILINIHQLLHLTDDIKSWGPLWTHNAFCYESMNGVFSKLFHGTQLVPTAAIKSLISIQKLNFTNEYLTNYSQPVIDFFNKCDGNSR
jgi:hypothetical protein